MTDDVVTYSDDEESGKVIASGRKTDFLKDLKKAIYRLDEALEEGTVLRRVRKSPYVFDCSPPNHMDIPTWDPETKSWYDAEY